ncbi:hypothetical protein [Chamaesiphon sp. VAR_69_metabat_338]|uniref:hypothetical protein n=1 Tax=Chamaesiphon sp. VAR_69_metabat_338 TaxID=2964704 RepID=UPI00286D966D|nr:hypothetical protein [Chamaesiphon sp. VAR_69_metabat_338]
MLEPLSQAKQSKIHDPSGAVNNLDRSSAEQLERNKAIQTVLRQWLDEELTPEESTERAQLWEDFKQIVDSSREPGRKLYSPE